MSVDIRQMTASPTAKDQGNIGIQGRVVPKTVKLALFTENRNAVWAGRQLLRKASYPFAMITFPANRKTFKYEAGDPFRWRCAEYGIVDMICRVLVKEEESVKSESIKVYAMEDIFSVALAVDDYMEAEDHTLPPTDYDVPPFLHQKVIEAPFAFREDVEVVPMACRRSDPDLGMLVYMSIDGGASYSLIKNAANIQPFGTLVAAYPAATYPIDDYLGFTIEFDDAAADDVDNIVTTTWPEVLAAAKNNAILGSELITFQTITPVLGNQYKIENIIRGRFDTVRANHAIGEEFYFLGTDLDTALDTEIKAGATRKFKLVPYNARQIGDISDATAITLAITGRALTPYIPSNLCANGGNFAARYDDDIILTWTPRVRGKGAGLGIPGEVLASSRREGLFRVEVWVGGVLVRTVLDIDAATWTYEMVDNRADNGGALADVVVLKVSNYARPESGDIFESAQATVTCKNNNPGGS